ncbi:unnamed protein product [Chilo suppressalis]|uniref:Cytochrome c oxidase polypeptide VIa n=1 Tax=Chilo suppressalis TaxID=168631 RepID=A0ABN8BAU1_CHISP|nr:unnamed protein product [Chilo suppressalis]
MLGLGNSTRFSHAIFKTGRANLIINNQIANYVSSTCCPPPKRPSGRAPGKSIGRCIPPVPPKCGGCRPPIAPNPCVPRFHHGKDTWKKYKFVALFICMPIIIAQAFHCLLQDHPHKGPCRDYEYMRLRTKKYPWGTGDETFFHNEKVNHLPGECENAPLDCD